MRKKEIVACFLLLTFIFTSLGLNNLAYAYQGYGDGGRKDVMPALPVEEWGPVEIDPLPGPEQPPQAPGSNPSDSSLELNSPPLLRILPPSNNVDNANIGATGVINSTVGSKVEAPSGPDRPYAIGVFDIRPNYVKEADALQQEYFSDLSKLKDSAATDKDVVGAFYLKWDIREGINESGQRVIYSQRVASMINRLKDDFGIELLADGSYIERKTTTKDCIVNIDKRYDRSGRLLYTEYSQGPEALVYRREFPDGRVIDFTTKEVTNGGQARILAIGSMREPGGKKVVNLALYEKGPDGRYMLKASAESLRGLPYEEGDEISFTPETGLRVKTGRDFEQKKNIEETLNFPVDRLIIKDKSGKEKGGLTQTSYGTQNTDGIIAKFSITTRADAVDTLTGKNISDLGNWEGLLGKPASAATQYASLSNTRIQVKVTSSLLQKFTNDGSIFFQAQDSGGQLTVIDMFDTEGRPISGYSSIGDKGSNLAFSYDTLPNGNNREVLTISERDHPDWISQRITTETDKFGEVSSLFREILPGTDRESATFEAYDTDVLTGQRIKTVMAYTVYPSPTYSMATYKLEEKDGNPLWVRTDGNAAVHFAESTVGGFWPLISNMQKQGDRFALWESDKEHWVIEQFNNYRIEKANFYRQDSFSSLTHGMNGGLWEDTQYIGVSALDTVVGFAPYMHPGLILSNFIGDPTGTVQGFADIVPGAISYFDSSSLNYDPRRGAGNIFGLAFGGKALNRSIGTFKRGTEAQLAKPALTLEGIANIPKAALVEGAKGLGTVGVLSLASEVATNGDAGTVAAVGIVGLVGARSGLDSGGKSFEVRTALGKDARDSNSITLFNAARDKLVAKLTQGDRTILQRRRDLDPFYGGREMYVMKINNRDSFAVVEKTKQQDVYTITGVADGDIRLHGPISSPNRNEPFEIRIRADREAFLVKIQDPNKIGQFRDAINKFTEDLKNGWKGQQSNGRKEERMEQLRKFKEYEGGKPESIRMSDSWRIGFRVTKEDVINERGKKIGEIEVYTVVSIGPESEVYHTH